MRPLHVRIGELALHPEVRVSSEAVEQAVATHLRDLLAGHALAGDLDVGDLSLRLSPALDADGIGRQVAEHIARQVNGGVP